MTLDGYSDAFSGPDHNYFQIKGDQDSGDPACGGPTTPYPVAAVFVPDYPDVYNVKGGIPGGQAGNYTGTGSTPSVSQVSLAANLQTVQGLNQLVQTITQSEGAVVIPGPADQTKMPSAMSSSNPMTVVVQGNLTLSGGFTGYGLLLVTGNFNYAPDTNWNGIVLVIGQGSVSTISGGSAGQFNGAMLIARLFDSSGAPLTGSNPGVATFNDATTSTVGRGYFYNCSWIQASQPSSGYKVLSFHEIAQ
jgi:hypothetical protein